MRILALGGIAGPVIFTTVVVLAAALRPGYSHYEAVISALGETGGPHALLMNAGGFVPTGFLLIGFALSLSRLVPRTALATAGAVCSGLLGAGIVGAGVFSCDLGCRGLGTSREAFLHIVASLLALPSGVVACAIWGVAFRSLPAWRSLSVFSLTCAVLSAGLLLIQIVGTGATGLWQRLFLGTVFFWCGVVGLHAFRISGVSPLPSTGSLS